MVSLIFFLAFLIMTQLVKIARLLATSDSGFLQVYELFSSAAISFLPLAAPLAMVFAANYSVGKMSSDSEIIALRSFGYSKMQIFKPFLLTGVAVGLSLFLLSHNLVPVSKKLFKEKVIDVTSQNIFAQLKSGQFFVEIPNLILFAQEVKERGDKLSRILIQSDKNDGDSEQLIFAESGFFIRQKRPGKELTRVRLILRNGNIFRTKKKIGKIEKVDFEEYEFPLFNNFYRKQKFGKPGMLPTNTLWRKIKNNEIKGKSRNKGIIELISRFNLPFQCVLFTILGCIFGIKKNRGKGGNQNFVLFGLIIGYYAIYFTIVSFVKSGKVPGLFLFTPTLIAGYIIHRYYKKLDWVS